MVGRPRRTLKRDERKRSVAVPVLDPCEAVCKATGSLAPQGGGLRFLRNASDFSREAEAKGKDRDNRGKLDLVILTVGRDRKWGTCKASRPLKWGKSSKRFRAGSFQSGARLVFGHQNFEWLKCLGELRHSGFRQACEILLIGQRWFPVVAEVVLDGFDKFTGRNVVCVDQEIIRMLRVKPAARSRPPGSLFD